ncbi:MAG: hypothetical protein FJ276_00425 [Planctomycetes bacterium]|nr:hypothetical protein [Planctomycetota bacterium]
MDRPENRSSSLLPVLRPLLFRLNAAVWLDSSVLAIGVLAGAWASGVLVLKMLGSEWLTAGQVSGLLVLLAPLYGYWRSRRGGCFFAPRDGAELADQLYRRDGLICALFEAPQLYPELDTAALSGEIQQALRQRAVRIRWTYFLKRLAPVLVYVSVVLLIPPRTPAKNVALGQEAMRSLTEPIVERLEENKERLPEDQRALLLADLEQLRETGEGLTREKWEALEHVEQQLQDALEQSRQATANVAESLQDLTSSPGFRDNPLAAAESPQFNQTLQDLKDAINLASQSLPPEILEQLADIVTQCDGMCQGGAQLSGTDREVLMKLAEQLQGQLAQQLEELESDLLGMYPGRGGVDRGRADAAMAYGDAEQLDSAQYERDRLKNRYLSPEDMVDLGITRLQPKPDPGKFSAGTLQSFEGEQGQAVSRTRISPSQREVVQKYFSDR